jgi:sialate O-acetylesterase
MAYFFGVNLVQANPNVPIGLIHSSWGGTDLEVWMSPASLHACGEAVSKPTGWVNPDPGLAYLRINGADVPYVTGLAATPSVPSTLWNSMIAPLLPLPVTGWLWYQVCAPVVR